MREKTSEPKWLLLPPLIRDRLLPKSDSDGGLPINLTSQVIDKAEGDSARQEHLRRLAHEIWDHLESGLPGWGPWPADMEDSLLVGLILGLWIGHEAEALVLELPEDKMAFIEDWCQQDGISLEQFLIQRIIDRVESREKS